MRPEEDRTPGEFGFVLALFGLFAILIAGLVFWEVTPFDRETQKSALVALIVGVGLIPIAVFTFGIRVPRPNRKNGNAHT